MKKSAASLKHHPKIVWTCLAMVVFVVGLLAPAGSAKFDRSDDTNIPAPVALTVVGASTSSISLAWRDTAASDSFEVRRNGTQVGTTRSPQYTLTKLACGKSFTLGV